MYNCDEYTNKASHVTAHRKMNEKKQLSITDLLRKVMENFSITFRKKSVIDSSFFSFIFRCAATREALFPYYSSEALHCALRWTQRAVKGFAWLLHNVWRRKSRFVNGKKRT